jgi:hypothetical protein
VNRVISLSTELKPSEQGKVDSDEQQFQAAAKNFGDFMPVSLLNLQITDKSIIQNNFCVPYLVTALEAFLRDFYIAYLEGKPELLRALYENKKTPQFDFDNIIALSNQDISIEQLIATSQSFQNLRLVNQAYSDVLKLKLTQLLFQEIRQKRSKKTGKAKKEIVPLRRKLGKKYIELHPTLMEMIEIRHKVVHTGFLDQNMSAERIRRYAFAVEAFVGIFAKYLLDTQKFRIILDDYML